MLRLEHHCMDEIIKSQDPMVWQQLRWLPEDLAVELLQRWIQTGNVSDDRLPIFFTWNRRTLRLINCTQIRRSVLCQIPFRCPELIFLDLTNCTQVSNRVVRAVLQGCPKLERLYLTNCRYVTDAAFEFQPFESLRACLSLKVINFAGCTQISPNLVPYLKSFRSLKELDFSHNKKIDNEAIESLLTMTNLHKLNLSFTKISDYPWQIPTGSLRELDLGRCDITDLALVDIGRNCQRLEVARLRWCGKITDQGLAQLAVGCQRLKCVELKDCVKLTDIGISVLGKHCSNMECLDVSWCNVTDDCIAAISNGCQHLNEIKVVWCDLLTNVSLFTLLEKSRRLKRIDIRGCRMTEAAIQQVKKTGITIVC